MSVPVIFLSVFITKSLILKFVVVSSFLFLFCALRIIVSDNSQLLRLLLKCRCLLVVYLLALEE